MTLDGPAARRLTDRIELRLGTIADNTEAVLPMIREAREGQADEALGYVSWTAYVAEEFRKSLPRLSKHDRQPIVAELSASGMSRAAIATAMSTSERTIQRDFREQGETPCLPLSPDPASHPDLPDFYDRPIDDVPLPPITGLDGKTYRRRPTPEQVEESETRGKSLLDAIDERFPDAAAERERSALRARWSKLWAAASEIPTMNPESVAYALDNAGELALAQVTSRELAKFISQVEAHRSNSLRLVRSTS